MSSGLRWPSLILLPPLLIAVVAAGVLFFTPTGVGVALAVADRLLGPALQVEGWSGTLTGTVCADSVVYRKAGIDVEAVSVCAQVNLWESFDFLRVSLAAVDAARVLVMVTATDDAPAPDPRDLNLPVTIKVQRAAIELLEINGFRIDDFNTRVRLDNDDLDSSSTFEQAGRRVSVTTSGPWQRLTAEGWIEVPETIALSGFVDLTRAALPFKATVEAASLALEPWTGRALDLGTVLLDVQGDSASYRYRLRGDVDDALLGYARVQAEGEGDLQALTLDARVNADPLATGVGAVEGVHLTGRIAWLPGFAFDLVADADAVPVVLAGYSAQFSGRVQGAGDANSIDVSVTALQGVVNDTPVAGEGALRWSSSGSAAGFALGIERVALSVGQGSVDAHGSVRPDAADLSITARNFALPFLYAPLGGRVSGSLDLSGEMTAPDIVSEVVVEELTFAGHSVARAEFTLGGSSAEGGLRVDLRGASLYAGRSTDGDAGEPLIADAGIRGSVVYRHRDTRWDVEVNEFAFEFEDPLAGVMQFELTTPGLVSYTEGRFELSEACLQARVALVSGSPARLCASGRYPEGPVHLEISDLHLVDFRTPINDISLSAGLAAKVDFSSLQPLIGSGGLQMTALTARPSADETLLLGDLSADLEIDTRAARLVLTTPQNQPLLIAGDLRGLVAQELMASNIEGEVRIDVDGIWAIETFLPMSVNYELARMRGALALDASVSGTFEEPVISGGVSVRDAGWDVLAVGAAFSEIGLDARLIDSQRMSFQAGGNLGGGAFKLTGTLEQLQSDDRQLTAALELEPGRVVDLPDYRADIGGQITVAMGPDSLQIEGELSMPSALIRIDALPAAAVGVSPDAVVIEDDAETEVAVRQIRRSNLKLTLGEDVRLEAFGLATGLRGSLRVQERPDEPPEVRGTINLRDGVFAAYGQELSVERGRLRFAGPMDDPSIDVLASRVVPYGENEVTVSLLLGGTAKAITTEVRSTPVLPEGDALALLMTGRTLSEMSSQEQTNVYGAAIALGMYGASGITETVASTLGLEEIIVEQDNLGEVKVGAAVRLNKDLYLRYTYGVFSRLGGVLLRYSLNKRLSVQGQAGDAQSIEIRYGVDG